MNDSYAGAGVLVLQNALGYMGLGEFTTLEFRARPPLAEVCLLLASHSRSCSPSLLGLVGSGCWVTGGRCRAHTRSQAEHVSSAEIGRNRNRNID